MYKIDLDEVESGDYFVIGKGWLADIYMFVTLPDPANIDGLETYPPEYALVNPHNGISWSGHHSKKELCFPRRDVRKATKFDHFYFFLWYNGLKEVAKWLPKSVGDLLVRS